MCNVLYLWYNIFKILIKKMNVENYIVVMCVNNIKEFCELENFL